MLLGFNNADNDNNNINARALQTAFVIQNIHIALYWCMHNIHNEEGSVADVLIRGTLVRDAAEFSTFETMTIRCK